MTSYTLMMNLDENEGAWEAIPNDLWRVVLQQFLLPRTDGIAFEGISNNDAATHLDIFDERTPPATACNVRIDFLNQLGVHVVAEYPLMRFSCDDTLSQRLLEVDFDEWSATSEHYPTDGLFFFEDARVIAIAVAVDSTISFYDATEDDIETLTEADDRIAPNLHALSDRTVAVELG